MRVNAKNFFFFPSLSFVTTFPPHFSVRRAGRILKDPAGYPTPLLFALVADGQWSGRRERAFLHRIGRNENGTRLSGCQVGPGLVSILRGLVSSFAALLASLSDRVLLLSLFCPRFRRCGLGPAFSSCLAPALAGRDLRAIEHWGVFALSWAPSWIVAVSLSLSLSLSPPA